MVTKTNNFAGTNVSTYFQGNLTASGVIGGGYETIEGSNHNLAYLGSQDCGGPCRLRRSRTIYTPVKVQPPNIYRGTDAYTALYGFAKGADLSDTQIKANGTTGIARSMPTNPTFSAGTALGELKRDGIPTVIGMQTWKARTKDLREQAKLIERKKADGKLASSEYLNYQFGWLPLLNDVRNFAYAVKNHRDILRDFKAGSGKNTRVSYNFNSSTRSEGYVRAVGSRNLGGTNMGSPQGTVSSKEETKARFTGCFTYHLPVGDSALGKAERFGAEADRLLGVRLTPEVLWNLTPWSWGVDWFTNTGDIIHNFSMMGHDSLVLKYGYSMHRRYYESIVSGGGATTTVLDDTYVRLPSSPYFGFGTTGELSATQSAILVALGINHMR